MANVPLTIALSDYDHFRDVFTGKIRAEGIDITHLDLPVEEIFSRFTRFREWDVSEMSFARYVSLRSQGDDSLLAMPVFPSRFFRQHAIYVATDRPLENPRDLIGRKVGTAAWVQTAQVWVRAYLTHQCGIDPTSIDWYQSGVNVAGHKDEVQALLPKGTKFTHVPDKSLTELLFEGKIDALISARPPQVFDDGDPRIRRMFKNYLPEEEAYFKETGIFPIMHTVVMKRETFDRHPWIGPNLFRAFEEAKRNSYRRALDGNICRFPIPWTFAYAERSREIFGNDFWPYGVEPNRKVIESFAQYCYEQGVAHRLMSVDDLFPASVHSLFEI